MLTISTLERLRAHTADKKLSFWQVASDGHWESAVRIDSEDMIDAWLTQTAAQDVAVEGFFADKNNRFFFIGVRLTALNPDEKAKFLKKLFHELPPGSTFETVQERMSAALSAPLFDGKPDILELGVEGLWKTAGPYTVWAKSEGLPVACVDEVSQHAAHLMQPLPRPLMLEYAWKKPYPHWIGLQTVGDQTDEGYRFCPQTYAALTAPFA